MTFRSQIVAGLTLIRQAIQSKNYSPGVSGWIIKGDGSAEFNKVTLRNGQSVSGVSLYYNGTPAPGTLVASISAAAGTDDYGNAYVAGFAVYSGATVEYHVDLSGNILVGSTTTGGIQITPGSTPSFKTYDNLGNLATNFDADSGIVTFLDNTNFQFIQFNVHGNGVPSGMIIGDLATTGTMPTLTEQQQAAGITISSNGGQLLLIAPTSGTAPKAAQVALVQGAASATTGGATPQVRVSDPSGSSDADIRVAGTVIRTNRAGTPYTLQDPAMGTGWAAGPAGGTVDPIKVHFDPLDQIALQGAFHVTGSGASSTCMTLPSGYGPVNPQRVPCVLNNANTVTAGFLNISTDGVVTITPVPSAGDVYVDAHMRRGNIS